MRFVRAYALYARLSAKKNTRNWIKLLPHWMLLLLLLLLLGFTTFDVLILVLLHLRI